MHVIICLFCLQMLAYIVIVKYALYTLITLRHFIKSSFRRLMKPYVPGFMAHNLSSMAILFIMIICAINCSGVKQVNGVQCI